MSKPQREETPPDWLNDAILKTALRKGLKNDNLEILRSEMKMATAVGDNYGSQMFRFNLTFEMNGKEEESSVIVKAIPPGIMGEELRKLQAFEKEEEAFSKALPAINEFLVKAYPDHKKLWAECYYHQGAPNNLLVLEDLRLGGFVLGNRFEGLDMEHSVLVLKSLAKLHAASLALKTEKPESLALFKQNFWHKDNTASIQNMFLFPFQVISKDILTWTDFDKKDLYSEKLKHMEETILDKVFDIWERDDSKMNVLLHGDSWVNNFMFRYDFNGKLVGINFVDFQMMNFNSPAMDLQYFIFTSVSPDLRFDYIDLFLKTYHETFEDTLLRLGHSLEEPYSLEQLKKDFEAKYTWGLIVLCTIFPLFLMPKSEVLHPDEFFKIEEGSNLGKMYKRENLIKILKRGFLFFDEKGVF